MRVIFTIVSANYMAYAATLMQSVRKHHPRTRRVIVLADRPQTFPGLDVAAEVICCDHLGVDLIDNMKLWYSVIEFNTAIKPFVFHYFLRQGLKNICYLDPDIEVYQPLDDVFAALRHHSCVLIPHIMQPLQDGKEPSDLAIMKSGVYNFGFFAIRNDPDATALVKWWMERLFTHCRVDTAENLFTDQRWMDLAPCFVASPCILRHPGYNVAYWNLAHRSVTRRGNRYLVDGQPLVFFHFSGINPDNEQALSKHQNRFPAVPDALAGLFGAYRIKVMQNGWKQLKSRPYAYNAFADGRPIEPAMRRWLLRQIDDNRIDANTPLSIESDYFDQTETDMARRGIRLTRFMMQFWLDRRDLQEAFNIYKPEGLSDYLRWFQADAITQGVDGRSVAAATSLTEGPSSDDLLPAPSWMPISTTSHQTPLDFICGDVEMTVSNTKFLLPRQIALLWERRDDLRRNFPLDTTDSMYQFIAWAITQGVLEGSVDPTLLSDGFAEQLSQPSDLTRYYNDVPITWGMLMTRHVGHQRAFLSSMSQFPVERTGRLAHGLWFAFVAPKAFGWPQQWTAPIRAYFDELSNVSVDGLSLTRASIAIWEVHPLLQTAFPLHEAESCLAFICWMILEGLPKLGISIDDLDPRMRFFLAQRSPRITGISRIVEMAHRLRRDLQLEYDIKTVAGRQAINRWAKEHLFDLYDHLEVPVRATPPERVSIALTGHSGASGRAEDLRCSVASLKAVGFSDYCVVDLTTDRIVRADGSACRSIHADFNICHLNADTAVNDWLHLRRLGVTADRTIGWWAWELEWLPSFWRHAYSFYDEIWASTRFSEAAFRRDTMRPVRLVPMAVVTPEIAAVERSRFAIPADVTLFLFMFDFRSYVARKNPEAVIQSFLTAFPKGSEKAALLLKSLGAAETPTKWAEIRRLCAKDRRIHLVDTNLSRAEAFGLIAGADAFVSLHRSEGFGRGVAEAMLLNVPVIATNYSGTADFASDDCALLVDYRMTPVRQQDYIGVEGQSWAAANTQTAARHMRHIHSGKIDGLLTHRARRKVTRLYDAKDAGHRILSALQIAHQEKRHHG